MAADVIGLIMDALIAVGDGIADFVISVFGTLVYDSATGLTDFASWGLIVLGFGLALSLFSMLVSRFL